MPPLRQSLPREYLLITPASACEFATNTSGTQNFYHEKKVHLGIPVARDDAHLEAEDQRKRSLSAKTHTSLIWCMISYTVAHLGRHAFHAFMVHLHGPCLLQSMDYVDHVKVQSH